jgi:hypothetical protein
MGGADAAQRLSIQTNGFEHVDSNKRETSSFGNTTGAAGVVCAMPGPRRTSQRSARASGPRLRRKPNLPS